MKNILIHCAMKKESEKIAKELNMKESEKIYKGEIEGTHVTLITTGIGKQKTAIELVKYLENNEKPDLIINVGYTGSSNTPIGTWVNVNKSYNLEWNIPGEEKYSMDVGNQKLKLIPELKSMPCYTAECFVTKTDIKEEVLFDMELHSVCLIADIYNIPVASIKQVSDNLSLNNYYENIGNVLKLEDGVKYIKKYMS